MKNFWKFVRVSREKSFIDLKSRRNEFGIRVNLFLFGASVYFRCYLLYGKKRKKKNWLTEWRSDFRNDYTGLANSCETIPRLRKQTYKPATSRSIFGVKCTSNASFETSEKYHGVWLRIRISTHRNTLLYNSKIYILHDVTVCSMENRQWTNRLWKIENPGESQVALRDIT